MGYSDDEGLTWKKSHSELFIAKDQGQKGIFQFEEPVVEELKDGRLMMLGRTETGRHYVSYSKDQGITWSPPAPGPVTAAYCATLLRRIPSTGDLLMIWNQRVEGSSPSGGTLISPWWSTTCLFWNWFCVPSERVVFWQVRTKVRTFLPFWGCRLYDPATVDRPDRRRPG